MEMTTSEIAEFTAETEEDLPPEFCRYRDEGCEFSPSCLSCRFPKCLYEEPRGRQRWVKGQRNREIARLFATGRWSARELAERFGLSQRTVQRALKSTIRTAAGQDEVKRRVTAMTLVYDTRRGEYYQRLALGAV